MIEMLLFCAIFLGTGLMSHQEYNKILDTLFLEMPEDTLLLDLEYVSSDINKAISIIQCYCAEHTIDDAVFGRYLMNGLKKAYYHTGMDIKDFASKAYALWHTLPSTIQSDEPFLTMCYADDSLSWGDEKLTRELYEKMLRFYDEQ